MGHYMWNGREWVDIETLTLDQLVKYHASAWSRAGISNSGLCISASANVDLEEARTLSQELLRRLEDRVSAYDKGLEQAACLIENNVPNLNKAGELLVETRHGKMDVVRSTYAKAIRALKLGGAT